MGGPILSDSLLLVEQLEEESRWRLECLLKRLVSRFGIPHCQKSHSVCESSRMSNTQVFNPI